MKVSIIVPVYNVEKYLKRCLNSLINQTLKDIEIICVNDGTKDNSDKILEEYAQKDSRIIIINQENQGLSAARNNGIKYASGEYLAFVDSDDWVDLDYFEKLYNTAKQNDCDIAVSGIIRLHKFKKKNFLQFNNKIITNDVNKKFELCDVPTKSYVWNKIYKKSMYLENNFQFEEGKFFEDLILTPQILYYSDKLITVPNTYYYYWRHPNSIVAKKRTKKNIEDHLYATKKCLDFIKEKNISIENHKTDIYRFQIFGLTIFKIKTKGKDKTYSLFNIIKWKYKFS